MTTDRGSKQTLAREAWQPLARYFFDTVRQRQRILAAYGLTPNEDTRPSAPRDVRAPARAARARPRRSRGDQRRGLAAPLHTVRCALAAEAQSHRLARRHTQRDRQL